MCFVCGIEEQIRLHLGRRTPEETALSILTEIVAVKNGHSGRSLRDAARQIRS
jgi:xanthine/CO dehydrogenase XdhC/CoxF family maturation factor